MWKFACSVCVVAWFSSRPARACTPRADVLVAWDLSRDLAVVGFWPELERPPAKQAPRGFELRRISTGEQVANHDCQDKPGPCAYEAAFAKALPAGIRWRTQGKPPPRNLRIRPTSDRERREVSLEARAGRSWRRVLWLQVIAASDQEWRDYVWSQYDTDGRDALLAFEVRARTGACSYTSVRALRAPLADLADPARKGRQPALMASPRRDELFEHWRTIAELGAIPPDRLLEALQAAENEGQMTFGAQWWREAIRSMTPAQRERLTAAAKKDELLYHTRKLLGM
jgi:hypothetical protein